MTPTDWTVEFNSPKFDEIKVELAEKYKLTPAEEAPRTRLLNLERNGEQIQTAKK